MKVTSLGSEYFSNHCYSNGEDKGLINNISPIMDLFSPTSDLSSLENNNNNNNITIFHW